MYCGTGIFIGKRVQNPKFLRICVYLVVIKHLLNMRHIMFTIDAYFHLVLFEFLLQN